jgi:ribonuclease BN (tRNA processing enzyme)
MYVIFIGTGGGRVNLIKQIRGTGGFRINGSANVYVDPGPGALIHSKRFKQDPMNVDVIIVTHAHIDHCHDAPLIIEAMSGYALKKRGILIGSRNVLVGSKGFDKGISSYHQKKAKKRYVVTPGSTIEFEAKDTPIKLETTKVKHDEPSAFGFKLGMDGKTIGYTSDSEYFKGFGRFFKSCDLLIANNLKPMHDGIPDHLCTDGTIKLLREAKPKRAVIQHLGMRFLRVNPNEEAEKITKESGVPTIAAWDGAVIELDEEKKKEKYRKLSEF